MKIDPEEFRRGVEVEVNGVFRGQQLNTDLMMAIQAFIRARVEEAGLKVVGEPSVRYAREKPDEEVSIYMYYDIAWPPDLTKITVTYLEDRQEESK